MKASWKQENDLLRAEKENCRVESLQHGMREFIQKIKSNYASFPHFTFHAFVISSFSGLVGKIAQGTLSPESGRMSD